MNQEDVFVPLLREHIGDLRSGNLPKGKFIGKYMDALNKADNANAFRFKRPQVIGSKEDVSNNWLDYAINLPENEFEYFMQSLNL